MTSINWRGPDEGDIKLPPPPPPPPPTSIAPNEGATP